MVLRRMVTYMMDHGAHLAMSTHPPVRILAVCGSLQARSGNRTLLETARDLALADADVTLFEGLRALPPFDPDVESAPEPVLAWRRALSGSDAVLVATPEYGHSLPGVLKNAVDWAIGSGELEGKVVGITAAVSGAGRGKRGLDALAGTLRAVSARIVGGQALVRGDGFNGEVAALVQALVHEVRDPAPPPEHGLGTVRPAVLVSAWVEAWNRGDAQALSLFYAPHAVNHGMAESAVSGREAIRDQLGAELAVADAGKLARTIDRVFEDGDWAIVEWSDARGLRGAGFFHVLRSQIVVQRSYLRDRLAPAQP
jgi:NAD(P)H-dependent FMN reductase